MKTSPTQGSLLPEGPSQACSTIFINERCRLGTRDGYSVLRVSGLVVAHYAVKDRAGAGYAMVQLVEQGWALQAEVARAYGCDVRTVRRNQKRVAEGGLSALGHGRGYPQGRRRTCRSRDCKVERWKAEGLSNREIAHRLGVT